MTHTGKLISRLVCTDWNEQISKILSKTSHFELTSNASNETLLDSNIEWTKIKISYRHTALPKDLKNLVTNLQLNISKTEVGLPHWMKVMNSFPGLIKLHIQMTDEETNSEHNVEDPDIQFRNLRPDFLKIIKNLEELSVTLPFGNYKALNEFLEEVSGEEMCLKTLCIKENWPAKTTGTLLDNHDDHDKDLLFSHVHRVISASRSTLTYLELDFNSKKIRKALIPDLVSKLSEVKDLKLQSALIQHNPIAEHVERDFPILLEFLNIQMTTGVLKNIILPWSSNASLCQDVVKSLPPGIEYVGNVGAGHLAEEFPSKFKKLKSLSFGEDISGGIPREEWDNIKQLQFDGKKYDFSFDLAGTFYEFFAERLSNLTDLKIICNDGVAFYDKDLQNITLSLKQLRVLHIEHSKVSDSAVTGVAEDAESILELVRTKKLYFYPNCIHADELIQNPLSSLQNLERLILTGTKITDIGIVLGFRFGSGLKHLTLGSTSVQLSDLGLHCLGASNPGLEAFYGFFESGQLSRAGFENLKRQFPLINATQKFKLLNVEPRRGP